MSSDGLTARADELPSGESDLAENPSRRKAHLDKAAKKRRKEASQ